VGVVSFGLLASSFGLASSQAQDTEFRNGTAKATAVALRIAPGIGSFQLGLAAGVAVSEYKNNFAQAQSEALDLGLVGSVLTAPSACSGNPILPAGILPDPTRVDNREGDAQLIEDALPLGTSALGVGHGEVRATTKPSANAISQPAVLNLDPVIKIDSLVANSTTEVIDGNTREAHATVEASITLLGMLRISGLRWDALHQTGAKTAATATFDPGTASLLNLPLPLEAFGDLETTLNNVLQYTGLKIILPKLERFTEPADVVRMTPLRIELRNSQLGSDVLGPILGLTRVQREELFTQFSAAVCELAGVPLLADVGIAIAGGAGFLIIDIGGAEATTADLLQESPFGTDAPPVTTAIDPTLPTLPTIPGSGPVLTSSPPKQAIADVGPLRDRCESLNRLSRTACSEGALLAAGLLGLVATVGVGGLDWAHQRRKRATAAAGVTS
jgi:hypothetical protein